MLNVYYAGKHGNILYIYIYIYIYTYIHIYIGVCPPNRIWICRMKINHMNIYWGLCSHTKAYSNNYVSCRGVFYSANVNINKKSPYLHFRIIRAPIFSIFGHLKCFILRNRKFPFRKVRECAICSPNTRKQTYWFPSSSSIIQESTSSYIS